MSIHPYEREKRARLLNKHVFLAICVVLVLVARAYPWWPWILMVWAPLIALHFAWSRGLFDRNKDGS
jgi:hypothetical protein